MSPYISAEEVKRQETEEKLKLLRSTHEFYDVYYHDWKFYLNSYEGGNCVLTQDNLFKHARENDEDYLDRVKRAHFLNYTNVVVDFYTNFIFSDVIERDGRDNDVFYQQFIKDVNRKGENIDNFMSQICTDLQIFGMVYVLVDSPSIDEISGADDGAIITQQFQEKNGIRPYWILIQPDEILDWDTDDFGNYLYVKRRQYDVKMLAGSKRKYEKFTEWYPDRIETSLVDLTNPENPELLEFRTAQGNNVGEVPFISVIYKKSKKYKDMGVSFICDIAGNNREILNITSLIDEFLYRQCFNMLARERDSLLPFTSADDSKFGTSNVIEYSRGGDPPQYITPPAQPAEFLQTEREKIIGEIYRQAIQDLRSDLANGEKSSGFSQAQSFSRTVPFIAARAETLERAENKLMSLTMKYYNDREWKGKVKYKDDYSVTNVSDATSHLLKLFKELALPSKTFAVLELKRLVQTLDGKIATEDLSKVFSEIDSLDFNDWQDKVIGQNKTVVPPADPNKLPTGSNEKKPATISEVSKEAKIKK